MLNTTKNFLLISCCSCGDDKLFILVRIITYVREQSNHNSMIETTKKHNYE